MSIFDVLFKRNHEETTGLLPDLQSDEDPRNLRFEDIFPLGAMTLDIPEYGDVEKGNWTLNQGRTASCTAHSTVHKLNQVLGKKLSPRYTFYRIKKDPKYNSSKIPWGAYMIDSLRLMVNEGICSLELDPNSPVTSDEEYLKNPPSDAAVKDAEKNKGGSYLYVTSSMDSIEKFNQIRQYMAVTGRSCKVGVNWRGSYNKVRKGGIVPAEPPSGSSSGHDMLAVAWKKINGHEYIGFRNSWGESWGDKGRIWLPKGFTRLQSALDYLPPEITEKAEIVKPAVKPLPEVRDYNLEKSIAEKLRKAIYKEFPEVPGEDGKKNFDARSLNGRMWLLLVPAVTYRGWTVTDVINFLYARSRGLVNEKAYSLDFNLERYV